MRAWVSFIVGCVLCVSISAGAQEISNTHFFPGVARLAGVPPSQWVSDVTVSNLNDSAVVVGFQFLPERTSHTFFDLTFPVRVSLEPLETRLFEDVLASLFGQSEDIKGGILITTEDELLMTTSNGGDAVVAATMRTYDVSSPLGGTAGQTVPSNGGMVNLSGNPSYVTGARNDSRFRSNLGLVSISLQEVTIHYRIRKSDGTVVAEGNKTLGSISMDQWSFDRLGVGSQEGPLLVELWLDPDDVSTDPELEPPEANSFFAYVSKIDSDSQDAEFMWAAPEYMD